MNIKRITRLLIAAACLGPVALRANDIEPTKERYKAPRPDAAIVLDGNLQEWSGPGVLTDPKFALPKGSGAGGRYVLFEEYSGGTWSGPTDQTSSVQVAWDEGAVYIGIVVTDDYHENAAVSAWNGDSAQIMIASGDRSSQTALYNYALGGIEEELSPDTIIMHEAGPGGTEAVVRRDTVKKKTYYEIKMPAASMGFSAFKVGDKFGLGMAINDGDAEEGQNGQRGWGGLGAHALVFGKSPSETAEITLVETSVTVTSLGIGTEVLLGGDLTDPENNGNETAGAGDTSWNWKSITASHEPNFGAAEAAFNIFDNVLGGGNDKWCCDDPTDAAPVWVAVEFPRAVSITHFTIASANDTPGRDPYRFQIQGSDDGTTWYPIYSRNNNDESLWTDRLEVLRFDLDLPSVAYNWVRYIAYHTPEPLHQLAEIEYFGNYVGDTIFVAGFESGINFFRLRIRDNGASVLNPASLKLKIDGVDIAAVTPTKDGVETTYNFTPASPYASGVEHTYEVEVTDNTGVTVRDAGRFTTPRYALLTAADKATPDTSKPGFIFNVHQNGAFQANNNTRPVQQLAGLLGVNHVDVTVQGPALAPGVPGANDRAAVRYEIPTVINLSQTEGEANGNAQPDEQMPGIPGIEGSADGIAAEIITYVELPAGVTTMIVNSDDGFRTTTGLLGDVFKEQLAGEFVGGRGASDTPFTIFVDSAGVYPFRTIWYEGGGGANIEILTVAADGVTKVLVNDTANGGVKAYRAAQTGATPTKVTSVSPLPGQVETAPDATITLVIENGTPALDAGSIRLSVNGGSVTPTVNTVGSTTTVSYKPAAGFPVPSNNSATLEFTAGTPRSHTWTFRVPPLTKDKVAAIPGYITGTAAYSPDQGGRTGTAGDYSMLFGSGGAGSVHVTASDLLNNAASGDEMTIAFWQKRTDVSNGSSFWINSLASAGDRAFQAHAPWGDSTIYFDTVGCCDGSNQRINANIADFPAYSGDPTWWNTWRHFVFSKKADVKNIWIDGQSFLVGSSANVLPLDLTDLVIGGGPGIADNILHGYLDDFVIYNGELTEAQVQSLAGGAAPGTVPGLLAHWDFNDVPVVNPNPPTLSVARNANGSLTVTFEGVLEIAEKVDGPYTVLQGVTGSLTIAPDTAARFARARRP